MGAYRLSSKGACAALAFSMLLASCGGGGGSVDTPNNPPPPAQTWSATAGTAEKGPLITGSAVTAQELDAALSPTGKQYSYQISSDLGVFTPTSPFTSQYIGVSATGYYFDEVLGTVSTGPLTLNGYSDLSVDTVMNVNILTTLAYQRLRTLVLSGKSFTDARAQAEGEVLDALNIPDGAYGAFGGLKISGNTDGAKLLAAISALFVQGHNSGEVSQLINNFQNDIGADGTLDNATTRQALGIAAITLRPDIVAANLNQRFASTGASFTPDDIARWIDGNGNGYVGELRFEVINANPATVYTLPSWAVATLVGKPLSGDAFIVNGASVTSVASVNAGDVISVRPSTSVSGVADASLNSGFVFGVVAVKFLAPVQSIALSPQGKKLRIGAEQSYTATVHFSDGSTASLYNIFKWTSSDPLVASVANHGAVTAHALGTTTITADFGSISASATLEVVPVVLQDFSVSPGEVDLPPGMKSRARLTGTYSDGLAFDVTQQATWHSVDPAIAAVDSQTGVISAVSLGTTRIEATVDSITRSMTINVTSSGHTAGPALGEGRVSHTATLLGDGKVLVAGGDSVQPGVAVTGEIYDPATGLWTDTGIIPHQHGNHEATLLADGRVLLSGGYGSGPSTPFVDIYDPASNQWSGAASMGESRIDHTSSLLPDGKVLVAGGQHDVGSSFATTEIYNPASNTWAAGPHMGTARSIHTATVLADGKVFVVGGRDRIGPLADSSVTATAELYDPATNSWSARASMSHARMGHSATLLPDGRVLVAGGTNISNEWQPPEIYDPVADAWSPAGTMATLRAFHAATLLPDGRVMVSGGVTFDGSNYPSTATVESYDPASNTWSAMESLSTPRRFHTATRLASDVILIVGGSSDVAPYTLGSTELYW